MTQHRIQRALLSVSDKSNIVELAKQLQKHNIEILSTGGTAKLLAEHNIPAIEVSDYTGSEEIMGGRVKTLHPKIYAGILGRPNIDDALMQEQNLPRIDLVVVNLYPFADTIAKPDCDLATAIENIDIGGPSMIRASAKNHAITSIVVDPEDYADIIQQLDKNNGGLDLAQRYQLAQKAFEHTAAYDRMIADYFMAQSPAAETATSNFPTHYQASYEKIQDLRYGENPHQAAAFYRDSQQSEASIASAQQLQGKALSYNNIADADAALECVKAFEAPACVIVKHANPCGVALGESLLNAYQRAFSTDPSSAFGGIIAFNRPLDATTAAAIIDQQFVEVIIAPSVDNKAQDILQKKPNVRVLSCGQWQQTAPSFDYKKINGGLLIQDRDIESLIDADLKVVSERAPTDQEYSDLLFCWDVAKFVKSNAIVYANNNMTIGIGAGQMSRVYSARIASIKAADENLSVQGAVMASDAFFPFRDGIDTAAEAGITAIIQPGGSMRDAEVIQAANEANIAMVFTGMRHFKH